jgi:hypothetical protein
MDEGLIFEVKAEDIKTAKEKNKGAKLNKISLLLDDEREFQCIARQPNNASIARYIQSVNSAQKANKDMSQQHIRFCFDNLIAPNQDQFNELVDKNNLSLLPLSLANELIKGSGMSVESKKKSL